MVGTDPARDRPPELDDRLPLFRRGIFDRQLRDLVEEPIAAGTPLSLVMIDLNRFKLVNDCHGHLIGDEVLLQAAAIVARGAAQKGTCYRYGGEEFTVLLPNYCNEEALPLPKGEARSGIDPAQLQATFRDCQFRGGITPGTH